ncbi:MAG TPA: hypothetical protein DCW68_07215 [Rhodospirillaceae bacterium]|nr:MAG: hypothetical protein A2018_06720 [Alphaproteobacteria bacterium GWF2_58_20]HAU29876.1 hypothetical protein [Rhodospirillaceae bacterium]
MSLGKCVRGVFRFSSGPRFAGLFLCGENMDRERCLTIDDGDSFATPMRQALLKVLQQPGADGMGLRIERVAEALVRAAEEGVLGAIKEINDRIDGKVSAMTAAASARGNIELVVDTGIGLLGRSDNETEDETD